MDEHRALPGSSLLSLLRERYGLRWEGEPTDLGGDFSLNLLLPAEVEPVVARVYPGWTTGPRLGAIQQVRRALGGASLPFAETVPTLDGSPRTSLGGRVVEVESYVPGESMDIEHGLKTGLPLLGRIHTAMRDLQVPAAAFGAPYANHVAPEEALEATREGAAAIRAAAPEEAGLGEIALRLAEELAEAELALAMDLPRQLVHGDFWDNNVLFRDGRVAVVLDLDFMGRRARIDDLALTLYYTNLTLGPGYTTEGRISRLAGLVDAYDSGLDDELSGRERLALPFALARTVLFHVRNAREMHPDAVRRMVGERRDDLEWSLEVLREAGRWQKAFLVDR